MPEEMKPDWTEQVRERLALPCPEDVVCELASHLEEIYADACARGASDTEAVRIALEQVDDWQVLAGEIARTKFEEESMNNETRNNRAKTVLLPAIAVLFGVGLMLLFIDRAAILQRVVWFACIALLLRAAASETNRLSHRTKSLWLPGFVSLTAASLLMFAEEFVLVHDPSFYFIDISLRPSHLVSGLPRWFYLVWLLVQVPCGALGAFLSRRSGGTRVDRILAGAFPALTMFFLCGLLIPISAFFEHNTFALSHPSGLALGVLIWAAVPAVATLVGAAPFLKESTLQIA
jgi:hypothetical protein